jgi:shikimate kinase
MRSNKVYLVGFMGAGKTTVARALGQRLGWQVADVDELIEASERRSITSIFFESGEGHFRQVERAVLHALLPLRDAVVATGGGTFVDADNRERINRTGVSIWLDIPFDRVLDRVPTNGRRPLARDRGELARLYELRRLAYAAAHLRVDADRPVPAVIEHIMDWLES